MPPTPFGEHLKRERELRGVSLEEVAAATRISTRFLEAIENEQWDQLPGGVFNRGFIRAIARFLGLDEDGLVAEYALETKGALDVKPAVERPAEIPRNWQPAAIAMLILILAAALGWVVYHRYGARIAVRFHRRTTGLSDAPRGAQFAALLPRYCIHSPVGGRH